MYVVLWFFGAVPVNCLVINDRVLLLHGSNTGALQSQREETLRRNMVRRAIVTKWAYNWSINK